MTIQAEENVRIEQMYPLYFKLKELKIRSKLEEELKAMKEDSDYVIEMW